ncbi:WXG100 family type VII secretion target [Peterkaempfera bronchialis]|uniref:WXG100 family type VII secretion target n=1 Tax=Peterkaempfera bronchialis TaxID=2126346 RepID=UPI001589C7F0|nr:WXG100 family type VII secretion target [Peterkaempfera bronchialis]
MDHTRLHGMVQSADPVTVLAVSDKLKAASSTMKEIADQLTHHMNNLAWDGDAADAFKDWGRKVASATDDLSQYTKTAGEFMHSAGSTLTEVRSSMPPVPEDDIALVRKYQAQPKILPGALSTPGIVVGAEVSRVPGVTNPNWVTASEAQAAQTRIDDAHQQAIRQMEKLGQSYEMSTDIMSTASTPTFPPTPTTVMPPRPEPYDASVNVPVGPSGSGGSTGSGSGGGGRVQGTTPTVRSGSTGGGGGGQVGGTVSAPHSPVVGGGSAAPLASTGIDGVTLAPRSPDVTSGPPPGTGGQGGGTVTAPPTGLPGTGGALPGGGSTRPGTGSLRNPGGGRAVVPGSTGGSGRGGGVGGGGGGRGGFGGSVIGEREGGIAGGTAGRRGGYGGSAIGAGAAETPGGTAGRGSGLGGSRGGFPGGGREVEGGAMGGGAGAGGGLGGGAGRASGASSGRRLAMEEGGMVGGRRGPGNGGEFTPGGSGLRARAGGEAAAGDRAGQGMQPGGGAGAARNSKGRRGQRPDYLLEDEETWTSGTPDSNPTVIE